MGTICCVRLHIQINKRHQGSFHTGQTPHTVQVNGGNLRKIKPVLLLWLVLCIILNLPHIYCVNSGCALTSTLLTLFDSYRFCLDSLEVINRWCFLQILWAKLIFMTEKMTTILFSSVFCISENKKNINYSKLLKYRNIWLISSTQIRNFN